MMRCLDELDACGFDEEVRSAFCLNFGTYGTDSLNIKVRVLNTFVAGPHEVVAAPRGRPPAQEWAAAGWRWGSAA